MASKLWEKETPFSGNTGRPMMGKETAKVCQLHFKIYWQDSFFSETSNWTEDLPQTIIHHSFIGKKI